MEAVMDNVMTLARDAEGYLKNFTDWTPEWSKQVAAQLNITLTEKHWDVINWLRKKEEEKVALSIRKVGNSGIVDIKQFYQLFPGAPLKNASKIAGIKKPVSCI
jgi:TusE/DsrC/DsvC family sulfur relay protein